MPLSTTYLQNDARTSAAQVYIGSTFIPQVKSIAYDFGVARVPTCTIKVGGSPSVVASAVFNAPVRVDVGFDGELQRVFTGRVVHVNPNEREVVIECQGYSLWLDVTYHKVVKTFDNITAETAITDLLVASGVPFYTVSVPAWTIGTVSLSDDPDEEFVTLEFQSYGEAIMKIGEPDGSRWMEMPTGAIIVRPLDPIPSLTAWRTYHSGVLTGLTETDPTGVTAGNRPRIRSLTTQKDLRSVKNRVYVRGVTVTQTNPDGTEDPIDIEGDASAPSPWVVNFDGTQAYNDLLFQHELIDTVAKANETAGRLVGVLNRLNDNLTAIIDGDPEVFLGRTVEIIDEGYTEIVGKYFVEGYSTVLDAENETFTTTLQLIGGSEAGGQINISPFALFTHSIEREVIGDRVWCLLTLDGSSSFDSDGEIVSWVWSGDVSGTGQVLHTRIDPSLFSGTIDVTLTVTDDTGATDAITLTIGVEIGDEFVTLPAEFVALGDWFSASPDGGITWYDQAVPGADTAISTAAKPPDGITFGMGWYGTQDGAVYRTSDFCQTAPSIVLAAQGSPMVHVWPDLNHAGSVWALTRDGRLFRSDADGASGTWALWNDLRTVFGKPNFIGARIATPPPDGVWVFGGSGDGLPVMAFDPIRNHSWGQVALGGELLADVGAALAGDASVMVIEQSERHTMVRDLQTGVWTETENAGDIPGSNGSMLKLKYALGYWWRLENVGSCESCTDAVGRIWRSPDGVTWTAIGAAASACSAGDAIGVRDFDFSVDGKLWVQHGTYGYCNEGDGVGVTIYRVDDPLAASPTFTAVDTYATQDSGFFALPNGITCHPTDASKVASLLARATADDLVRHTTNGQAATPTFSQVTSGVGFSNAAHVHVAFASNGNLIMLAQTSNNIYVSSDMGANWSTPVTTLQGSNLSALWGARGSSGQQFVSSTDGSGHDIWRTLDGGATWTRIFTVSPGTGESALCLTYDEVEDTVYVGFSSSGSNALLRRIDNASTVGADAASYVDLDGGSLQDSPVNYSEVTGIAVGRRAAQGGGGADLYVADAANTVLADLAIILNSSAHTPAVYYTTNSLGDGSAWRRATGAPNKSRGRWMTPNKGLVGAGQVQFGFDDHIVYLGDVTAGVMAVTSAVAELDSTDDANHGLALGDFIGGIGGAHFVCAEGSVDGTIYKTWDRFGQIGKHRPATGFDAMPAGANAKMINIAAAGQLSAAVSDRLVHTSTSANPDEFKTLIGPTDAWSAAVGITGSNGTGQITPLTDQIWWVRGGSSDDSDAWGDGVGFRTLDGGATWAAPTDPGVGSGGIMHMAIDAGGRIWCITHQTDSTLTVTKVYYSDDNMVTWTLSHSQGTAAGGQQVRGYRIFCHPTNQNIIAYAATGFDPGATGWIVTTLNRGGSWTERSRSQVNQNQSGVNYTYQAFFLNSGRMIFSGPFVATAQWRVYYTDDYGATSLNTGFAGADAASWFSPIAVVDNGGSKLALLYEEDNTVKAWVLKVSTDGGASFATVPLAQEYDEFSVAEGYGLPTFPEGGCGDPVLGALYVSESPRVFRLMPVDASGEWTDLSALSGAFTSSAAKRNLHVIPRP